MEKFFYPQSVVVFGVSDSANNLGRDILENLDRFGFTGRAYAVGRPGEGPGGRLIYERLEEVPEIPELAVLLIPAPKVAATLELCGRKGVRHVVIETGGFSELGDDRKGLEEEICRVAGLWEIDFIGPNCIGVINTENGLCLPFVPFYPREIGKGSNSFISQSGGLVHEIGRRFAAENMGLNKLVSMGNKLKVNENHLLDFLARDPGTDVIGVYLEDIKDGRKFMDLARGTTKPVMLLKGNASPAGKEIAGFHTSALAGDDGVMEAALKQAGIHRVESMQEMVDCFKIFDLPLLRGPNLALMSRSGGQAVLLADGAHRHGFALAKLPEALFARVKEQAKAGVVRNTNPLDLGDVFDESFYLEVLRMALEDPGVDGVVFFFDSPLESPMPAEILGGVERLCRLYQKPVVFCMIPFWEGWFELKYACPFPFFTDPETAMKGLRRSLDHFRKKNRSVREAHPVPEATDPSKPLTRIASAAETLALVHACGVPVVEYEQVRNKDEGVKAARRLGYPVVLKRIEPFVLHKTEAGALRLDIQNDEDLERAFVDMPADEYLVQKMAPGGVETIIGGKQDPAFGPVVLFGLGGIFVEILKDVTMRIAPIDEKTALEMIEDVKGAALLKGSRGTAVADTGSLSKALASVSRLLVDHPEVLSIDINPLRVFDQGRGCLALDVKIEYAG
jgi:acetyltransferase